MWSAATVDLTDMEGNWDNKEKKHSGLNYFYIHIISTAEGKKGNAKTWKRVRYYYVSIFRRHSNISINFY